MRLLGSSVCLAVAIAAIGLRWDSVGAHGRISSVTWAADIRPLFERHCAGCHRPERIAAVPLLDFEQATRMAPQIKSAVLARRMPPWHAAPGFGDFANDASLTPHEIGLLVSWADGGTPRGSEPAVAASATTERATAPDLVLTPRADTPITTRRQRFTLRTHEKTDKWIQGWEFKPGSPFVRQAHISLASGQTLGVWVPPVTQVDMPEGVAQRLRAGEVLTMEIEYAKPDDPTSDRSSVALFFGPPPARERRQMTLGPGTTTLPGRADLLSIRASLRASGESVRVVARRPDGTVEPLLWVREYDSSHQMTYRFRRPVTLPAGSQVDVFSFDGNAAVHLDYTAH